MNDTENLLFDVAKTFIGKDIVILDSKNDKNVFSFKISSPKSSYIAESIDGVVNNVSEDYAIVKFDVSGNTVEVIENYFSGWRRVDGKDKSDPDAFIVENIIENKDIKKYSVVNQDGQSFLQCCETHISYSLGTTDSFGGEKGNGFGPNKSDVKITKVPVSNDYKITDGCVSMNDNKDALLDVAKTFIGDDIVILGDYNGEYDSQYSLLDSYNKDDRNAFAFKISSPRSLYVAESIDGELNEVSEDYAIVKFNVPSNSVEVIENYFSGWRKVNGKDKSDPDTIIVENIKQDKIVKLYSIVKENGQSFLQCNETNISYSYGTHDSLGGEKDNGYGPNKSDEKITRVPVSNDYKITDGRLFMILVNAEQFNRLK